MTRKLSFAAFAFGAALILWMGSSFIGTNLLALFVSVIIAGVYTGGFIELLRFQRATATLSRALVTTHGPVDDLDHWLGQLHPSLHTGVRLRIQGEHIGLPAPIITPYLVGLLVMLGLLGTFVGMVETLKGAVYALEGTNELQAIRAGLAAPIKGLGVAFGTSVAGVAASAMLGLISTLSRRERIEASHTLDGKVATAFTAYSLAHNRQQTFKALQAQAQALPDVAARMEALAEHLGRLGDTIGDKLLSNQTQFHQSVQNLYHELANSVGQSLRTSLAESGRLAGQSIEPVVSQMMAGISQEARRTQEQLGRTVETQMQSMRDQFMQTAGDFKQAWQTSLAAQEHSNQSLVAAFDLHLQTLATTQRTDDELRLQDWRQTLSQNQASATQALAETSSRILTQIEQASRQQQASLSDIRDDFTHLVQELAAHWRTSSETVLASQHAQATTWAETAQAMANANQNASALWQSEVNRLIASSEQLVQHRIDNEKVWLEGMDTRLEQLTTRICEQLEALHQAESVRSIAALDQLAGLEAVVTRHLGELGKALEAPMTRLIQTASETPKAAAEVIERLRDQISKNIEKDNALLSERQGIMEDLNSLSARLADSAAGQRQAIEKLVTSSTEALRSVSVHFNEQVGDKVNHLTDVVDQFAGSAAELASLGDAFGMAVELFTEANTQLVDKLKLIEQSLDKASSRSDEQLAYYVAQARELIDHSMLSQQELIEQIRSLSRNGELVKET